MKLYRNIMCNLSLKLKKCYDIFQFPLSKVTFTPKSSKYLRKNLQYSCMQFF